MHVEEGGAIEWVVLHRGQVPDLGLDLSLTAAILLRGDMDGYTSKLCKMHTHDTHVYPVCSCDGFLPVLSGLARVARDDPLVQVLLDLIVPGGHHGIIVPPQYLHLQSCQLQCDYFIHWKFINLVVSVCVWCEVSYVVCVCVVKRVVCVSVVKHVVCVVHVCGVCTYVSGVTGVSLLLTEHNCATSPTILTVFPYGNLT